MSSKPKKVRNVRHRTVDLKNSEKVARLKNAMYQVKIRLDGVPEGLGLLLRTDPNFAADAKAVWDRLNSVAGSIETGVAE